MNSKEIFTNIDAYFFDTYAIFEILKGNKNYEKYRKCRIITTKLNLFELYFGLLKEVDEETASINLKKYYEFIIDFDEEVIKKASSIKLQLNKRDVSMTDCIGYALAMKIGVKFLTGDKEFENLNNVEFVK